MIIDYFSQEVFTKSLDIVDAGNTAVRAKSADSKEYYILTKTILGKTNILKFGPVLPDLGSEILLDSFTLSYIKIDYKETKIENEITRFVNDPKKKIEELEEVTEYEAFEDFPEIKEIFLEKL